MDRIAWREKISYFTRGYWSARPLSWWDISRTLTSITLVAFSFWFLIAVYQGLWAWHLSDREAAYQYNLRAEQNRETASRSVAEKCLSPLAPVDIVARCLTSEWRAHVERAATYENLEAQQEIARWSKVTGIVATISLPLSALGVIFLLISLRQTRLAISTDREVGHAQVRAYVSLEPALITDVGPEKILKGKFKISNSGQSPAHKVLYVARIFLGDDSFADSEGDIVRGIPDARKMGAFIPANGSIEGEAESTETLSSEDVHAVMVTGEKKLFLVCIVTYLDVFGVGKGTPERKTRFCAYLEREGGIMTGSDGQVIRAFSWFMTGPHNDAT